MIIFCISAEVHKQSAVTQILFFDFLKKVWTKEHVPAELVMKIFVMIFIRRERKMIILTTDVFVC